MHSLSPHLAHFAALQHAGWAHQGGLLEIGINAAAGQFGRFSGRILGAWADVGASYGFIHDTCASP